MLVVVRCHGLASSVYDTWRNVWLGGYKSILNWIYGSASPLFLFGTSVSLNSSTYLPQPIIDSHPSYRLRSLGTASRENDNHHLHVIIGIRLCLLRTPSPNLHTYFHPIDSHYLLWTTPSLHHHAEPCRSLGGKKKRSGVFLVGSIEGNEGQGWGVLGGGMGSPLELVSKGLSEM